MKNKTIKDFIIIRSFDQSLNDKDEIVISLKTILQAIKQSQIDPDQGSLVIQFYSDYYFGYDPNGTSIVLKAPQA